MVKIGKLLKERLDVAYEMRIKGGEAITPHLIGPPGVGKTTFVKQWAIEKAKELGLKFVDADEILPEEVQWYLERKDEYFVFKDCRLTSLDPIDLMGVPRAVDSKFTAFLPLSTARLLNACAGVLFLDEFANESRPNMRAAAYKLVRDYKMGDVVLNKRVLVIAASNSSKHSNLVTSLPKPLRDRFDFIEVEAPDIDEWADWMDRTYGTENWSRVVLAYLRWRPSDFLANIEEAAEDDGYSPPATPRGWSYTGLAIRSVERRKGLTEEEREQLIDSIAKGKLGAVGESFNAFRRNRVPTFEELVSNPEVIKDFRVEQKYLAAMTIAEAIKAKPEANIAKAKKVLIYIAERDDKEFLVAVFAMLPRVAKLRQEVYKAVKDNKHVAKCMESVGKILLGIEDEGNDNERG